MGISSVSNHFAHLKDSRCNFTTGNMWEISVRIWWVLLQAHPFDHFSFLWRAEHPISRLPFWEIMRQCLYWFLLGFSKHFFPVCVLSPIFYLSSKFAGLCNFLNKIFKSPLPVVFGAPKIFFSRPSCFLVVLPNKHSFSLCLIVLFLCFFSTWFSFLFLFMLSFLFFRPILL